MTGAVGHTRRDTRPPLVTDSPQMCKCFLSKLGFDEVGVAPRGTGSKTLELDGSEHWRNGQPWRVGQWTFLPNRRPRSPSLPVYGPSGLFRGTSFEICNRSISRSLFKSTDSYQYYAFSLHTPRKRRCTAPLVRGRDLGLNKFLKSSHKGLLNLSDSHRSNGMCRTGPRLVGLPLVVSKYKVLGHKKRNGIYKTDTFLIGFRSKGI